VTNGGPIPDSSSYNESATLVFLTGKPLMAQDRETPFDSLESAHEYLSLMREALEEAYVAIQEDTAEAQRTEGAERRLEALRLVDYKLNQLRRHLLASLVLTNDLRTLRRLLLGERDAPAGTPAGDE
jgi:glucose-6-phosphate-specific signal transduction histidine kinase